MKLLLMIFILLQISLDVFASEQKEIEVRALGKILQDKRTNEFYFVFMDKDQNMAYPITIKNKKILEQLKKLKNKWVRVSGHSKRIKETFIELPRFLLKLEIEQLQEFQLAELKAQRNNDQSKIAVIDYRVIDGDKEKSQDQTGIAISDEAANDIIAGAGVVMGIAIGPISLIPAGLFGLKSLLLDD